MGEMNVVYVVIGRLEFWGLRQGGDELFICRD